MQNFLAIIVSFGKIGLISLGGGNSMLKLLEYEAVSYRQWVGAEEFVNMLGTSFLFPGLTGVKLAALIGYKAAGIWGLILAVFALNLPGLLLAICGYAFIITRTGPLAKKIMIAVQYGSLALLFAATYSIGQSIVSYYYTIPMVIAAVIFFLALAFFNLSPFWGFLAFIGSCIFIIR